MSGEKCSGETITQVTYPVDPARANIQIIKFTFPHKDSACFKTAGADPKLLKKISLRQPFILAAILSISLQSLENEPPFCGLFWSTNWRIL